MSLRGLREFLAEAGLDGVRERLTIRAPDDLSRPLNSGQMRAFYGKTSALAQLTGHDSDLLHDQLLAEASEQFGRTIASVRDLTQFEADWVLDQLRDRIRAAKARLPAPDG